MRNQPNARSVLPVIRPVVRDCAWLSFAKSGQVKRITNALGHSRTLAYDKVGNLKSVTGSGNFGWSGEYAHVGSGLVYCPFEVL